MAKDKSIKKSTSYKDMKDSLQEFMVKYKIDAIDFGSHQLKVKKTKSKKKQ